MRLQSSGPGQARLFWRRNDTATEVGQVQAFAVATGAAMQTYTLDLSEHPEWKGTITGLRLDPSDGGAGNAAIDWIRVSW